MGLATTADTMLSGVTGTIGERSVNAASNFPKCAEVKFPSWRAAVISRLGGDRGLYFWVAARGGAMAVPGLAS